MKIEIKIPKRNDVFLISLPNQSGNETRSNHYALIISNNIHNFYSPRVVIIPITSKVIKLYPYEHQINTLKIKGKLMLDQIRSCDKKRLIKKIDVLKDYTWEQKLKSLLEI